MTAGTGAAEQGRRGEAPVVVPGPKGVPLLGSLPEFGKDPLAFFERLRDHGDVVSWNFGGQAQPLRRRPGARRGAAARGGVHLRPAGPGVAFRAVLGNGVTVARGRDWRRKRSLVQPSVRPKQVQVLRGDHGLLRGGHRRRLA